MQIFLVLALIIALIAVVFTIQNTALVTVTFLFWDLNQSLAFVVLLAILSGVLISQFVSVPGKVKRTMENTSQKKKIKELDTELMSTKVRLEALKQELEIYHNQLDPSTGEVAPDVSQPVSSTKNFLNGIKAKLKP
jgi:putative membrane protein